jgi:hypothetical protein
MKWINRGAAKNSNPFPHWAIVAPLELFKNIGNTPKRSVPVLSTQTL